MRHLLIDSKESLLLFVELVIDTREKLVSSVNSFTCSSDQIQFLQNDRTENTCCKLLSVF